MAWFWAAICSALLLGLYDSAKKRALQVNGVFQVLLSTTAICSLFFMPLILSSLFGWGLGDGTIFEMPQGTAEQHIKLIIKAVIVSLSWIFGFYGLKHLPLSTVGIIKATRPVFVLLGCIILFGEHLNLMQWAGVIIAMTALFLLGRSSKSEGIDFAHNKWIFCMAASVLFGVISALYDKYIMKEMNAIFVQGWCDLYIALILAIIVIAMNHAYTRSQPSGENVTDAPRKFRWDWTILEIAFFITISDFLYFYSLSRPDSLLAVVSILRRSSVLVTLVCGAVVFREKNIRAKTLETILLLAGMILLVLGSR